MAVFIIQLYVQYHTLGSKGSLVIAMKVKIIQNQSSRDDHLLLYIVHKRDTNKMSIILQELLPCRISDEGPAASDSSVVAG